MWNEEYSVALPSILLKFLQHGLIYVYWAVIFFPCNFSVHKKQSVKVLFFVLHCFLTIFMAQNDCQLVRDCISGYIYDSSPVDFTSDMGARFILHPSVLKVSHPPRFASWIANGIASGLDSLFLSRFESQRAEYWRTLYSTTVSNYACMSKY